MEKECINGQVGAHTKETLSMGKSMDLENLNGKTEATMKEDGCKIIMRGKGLFVGVMEELTKENGKTI